MSTPSGPLRPYPAQHRRGRHSRDDAGRGPDSPLPWLFTAVGALAMAAVILAVAFPGWYLSSVLDRWAVQRGVAAVLTDSGYRVGAVSCPAGQPVEVGHRFSCTASIDGVQRDVTVTVRTAGGEYAVAAPR